MYSSSYSSGSDISVSFQYLAKRYSSSTVVNGDITSEYSVDGGSTWINLTPTATVSSDTSVPCTQVTATIPGSTVPAGTDFRFRINMNYVASAAATSDYYMGIDDVHISQAASCFYPLAFTNSGNSATSSTFTWTAPATAPAGYDIYYSTSNTAPTAATVLNASNSLLNVTGTTATISGLTPNTSYYVWIRGNCGTSQSQWGANASSYTGLCTPTGGSGSTSYYLATVAISNAQTNYNYSATSYNAYVDDTANSFSAYPGQTVSYSMANSNSGTCYFYIWADWNDDLDFADAGETMLATTTYQSAVAGTMTIPASAPVGAHRVRYGLSWSGAITPCGPAPYGNYVDSTVNVVPPPSCRPSSGVPVPSVTTSGATVNWTASSSAPANGYDLYYSTTNTAPAASAVPNQTGVTGTSAVLSGLSPSTTYYVWVRSRCSAASQSVWTSAVAFTTQCTPVNITLTAPYVQDFESAATPALPGCTSVTNAGTGNVWITVSNPGSGFTTNTLEYPYSSTNPANTWFFTQGMNLVAGTTYYISYRYGNNSTVYQENQKVAIGMGADAASMTTVINDHPDIQTAAATSVGDVPFTPTVSGVYYLGFQAYSLTDQYYLFVDDIKLSQTMTLGTAEIAGNQAVEKVYPNPFTDFVDLSMVKDAKSAVVADASGRIVASFAKVDPRLDLSRLNAGLYILSITKKDGTDSSFKIIKR